MPRTVATKHRAGSVSGGLHPAALSTYLTCPGGAAPGSAVPSVRGRRWGRVVAHVTAQERMQHPLDELRTWLEANNAAVMAVLLLVLGVKILGSGLGGLF